MNRALINKSLAELIGTATLTAAVLAVLGKTSFPFFVAITAGLTLCLMVFVIGRVSGAHINPAITLGFLSKKAIEVSDAIAYIVAQLLGAFLALGLYQYLSDRIVPRQYTEFDWRFLVSELAGAFVFGLGVRAATSLKLETGALAGAVGLSLTLGILVASAGSNAILNPAVALGLKSFTIEYIVGPVIGVIVGFFMYDAITATKTTKKK